MKRLALLAVFAAVAALAAQTSKPATQKPAPAAKRAAKPAPTPTKVSGTPQTTASGVEYWDIKLGAGKTAIEGKKLSMTYVGWFADGRKFDSSQERYEGPYEFTLGKTKVMKGWEEGVAGMKVGGKRQLKVPPSAAYGEHGAPPLIPPNATLIFDIELLDVK